MKVAILTPIRSGHVHHAFTESLARTMHDMRHIELGWFKVVGCTILPDARSVCLADALGWGADKVIFIDDDVSWTPADLHRVISHDVAVVSGLYPCRLGTGETKLRPAVVRLPGGREFGDFIELDFAGFGFLKIDRDVFDVLQPHAQFMKWPKMTPQARPFMRDWFPYGLTGADGMNEPARRLGEDENFCRRLRSFDIPVYLDRKIILSHFDGGHEYRITEIDPL